MMPNGMMLRPKTIQEKEFDKLPFCPYDNLTVMKCRAPQIAVESCRECFVKSLQVALWSEEPAFATSILHGFVNFIDKHYVLAVEKK